jgi:hypothetical protein
MRELEIHPATVRRRRPGGIACLARQFVASRQGAQKNAKTAGNSVAKCAAKALGGRQRRGHVNEPAQACQEATARDREPLLGDRVRVPTVTEREPVEERLLHGRGPGTPRMIVAQGTSPADQVGQTRLVQGGSKLAVGRRARAPAVSSGLTTGRLEPVGRT